MPSSHPLRWTIVPLCAALAAFGCASTDTEQGATGSLSLDLVLAGDIDIDVVDWAITGNGMDMGGSVDVSAPGSTASVEVYGLPVGEEPYVVELSAISVDKQVTCRGSAEFDVEVGVSTPVMVILNCKLPQELGGVRVNGKFNVCAQLTKMVVSPLQTSVGNDISLFSTASDEEGDPIAYMWTSHSGSIADPVAASTTYTCTEVGDDDITVLVTDDDGTYCMSMWTVRVTCVDGDGGDLCDDVICEDDGNECTDEACNPANGQCEASNNTNPCNDDTGTCSAGECVPNDLCMDVICEDDGNECTDEACNPANGQCEASNNTNPCNDDTGTCSAGECVPNDLCMDVVCEDDGNECTDEACNPANGQCETSNNTNACENDTGTCNAGVCEPNAEVVYSQDFEALDPAAPDALSSDGWLYFGNVYNSTGGFKFGFGPFAAPTTSGQISGIVTGEGGPDQGAQQLVVFSNYDCCQPGEGHFGTDLVETIVFQEVASIPADFIGQTFTFTFDAKRGNIGGSTTAEAFIKTLDPGAGFATTNNVVLDTTALPTGWGTYSITLDLTDPLLQGQILQFGYSTVASNFEPAGNFYDNDLATLLPTPVP